MDLALQEQEHIMYEEKLRMLINISHELRTPLTLIMAPLKRLIGSTSPEAESYPTLNRIYRQSRRMGNLLNMVLELRKMEVGKSRLKIESIEYNAWIRSTIADIIEEEHLEGIEVITDFDSAVNTVECDRQKCDTILMNILINAIKHSSKGDTITIRTRLGEDNMVITSISDQGVGLKDIDMSRLFTTFYQSNSEEYGSGIGLSYSKILVELHGGNIFAENNIDKGATFWWTLPVKSAHDATSDLPTKAYLNELIGYNPLENASDTQSETFNTSGMKLMLVDDNRDLLEFLNEALNGQFAEIIMVSSGNKALQVLSSGKLPDIIVSDVNMPDGDGFYLCKELKANENYSNIPVILLTASGEEQSQIDSYRMGAESFMAKPFEVDTLMELLRNILRRKADIRKRYLEISGESATEYGSNEENFILKLNKIIAEHISNPEFDQVLICKELGVSRALLYNKMKAITGAGAKEYITRIRLEKAKSLIENTNRTIAEISDMTGFASQSYFSTAFKAYTGMTPSQYKKHTQAES
jgi:DNA-binding response OmpR family regulator